MLSLVNVKTLTVFKADGSLHSVDLSKGSGYFFCFDDTVYYKRTYNKQGYQFVQCESGEYNKILGGDGIFYYVYIFSEVRQNQQKSNF